MADSKKQDWSKQQKLLRTLLSKPQDVAMSIKLCLNQHTMVHSSSITNESLSSFEDEFWEGLTEDAFRKIPSKSIYSIAWHYWHMTRIEDMTMNVLVKGTPQIYSTDGWHKRVSSPFSDTGNSMNVEEIKALSSHINIEALRAYRCAVGKRTKEIIKDMGPDDLKEKVNPLRLQELLDDGSVTEDSKWLLGYWGNRNLAELLLMPATRHNFIHFNEAGRIKNSTK